MKQRHAARPLKCYTRLSHVHYRSYVKSKEDLSKALTVLEKHLSSCSIATKFLVGDRVTLADIVVVSTLYYPFKLCCSPEYLSQFQNVRDWFMTCVSQAEFSRVVGQQAQLCLKEVFAKDHKQHI